MPNRNKLPDLMIDLETLGNRPGSVITQIGLVSFNRLDRTADMGVTQIQVDADNALSLGLTMDWDTIKWWLTQDQTAREQMVIAGEPLATALQKVTDHISTNNAPGFNVWGYASTFDVVMMESAYRAAKMDTPWDYRQHSCLRTLAKIYTNVARPETEHAHVAVYDAMAQARWCQEIFAAMEDERSIAAKYRSVIN